MEGRLAAGRCLPLISSIASTAFSNPLETWGNSATRKIDAFISFVADAIHYVPLAAAFRHEPLPEGIHSIQVGHLRPQLFDQRADDFARMVFAAGTIQKLIFAARTLSGRLR